MCRTSCISQSYLGIHRKQSTNSCLSLANPLNATLSQCKHVSKRALIDQLKYTLHEGKVKGFTMAKAWQRHIYTKTKPKACDSHTWKEDYILMMSKARLRHDVVASRVAAFSHAHASAEIKNADNALRGMGQGHQKELINNLFNYLL